MKRMNLRILAGIGAALLVTMAMATPALAGGKDGSGYTEDNDSNDNGTANNVADAGDNKHPSGNDKSVEHGKSGNQGKSGSDPDGDSNGGADKPNGPGGSDKADQDGNNGCGNDDDFEDDNNGNCGKPDKDRDGPCVPSEAGTKGNGKAKGKAKGHVKDCTEDSPPPEDGTPPETDDEAPDVLGSIIGRHSGQSDDVLGSITTRDDEVAAAAAERESGSSLPFTGVAILALVALAGGLLTVGALFMSRRKARI